MTIQKQSPTQRRYESLTQAADRTGVSTRTLRRRIAAGELRAFRAGARIIRLDPNEVDALFIPTS